MRYVAVPGGEGLGGFALLARGFGFVEALEFHAAGLAAGAGGGDAC